jgi:cytochrome b561
MSSNDSLSKIPITVEVPNYGMPFHTRRRITQLLFIFLLVVIPVSGLLRIDMEAMEKASKAGLFELEEEEKKNPKLHTRIHNGSSQQRKTRKSGTPLLRI